MTKFEISALLACETPETAQDAAKALVAKVSGAGPVRGLAHTHVSTS